jgi:hypothetical protein
MREQLGSFTSGSRLETFVTPTPYSSAECTPFLDLPAPDRPRTHALFLDPRRIPVIAGPRWVRFGKGIEYVLPDGFEAQALVQGWEIEVR